MFWPNSGLEAIEISLMTSSYARSVLKSLIVPAVYPETRPIHPAFGKSGHIKRIHFSDGP
jgi:hypothetical protein